MFLGNNFREINLTIPVHRGIISREEDKSQQKKRKKVDAAAGACAGGRIAGGNLFYAGKVRRKQVFCPNPTGGNSALSRDMMAPLTVVRWFAGKGHTG